MKNFDKILLIDDDPIQNLINTKLLNRLDFSDKIDVAVNGKDALEKYIEKASTPPQVIFLDINMPIMNGWDFLDILNKKGWDRLPKIYMLTSSISPEDIQKSEAHPMVDNYITKPLNLEKLGALKTNLLQKLAS